MTAALRLARLDAAPLTPAACRALGGKDQITTTWDCQAANVGGHSFCRPVQNLARNYTWTAQDHPLDEAIGFDGT